jgi:hypothetical protein
VVNLRTEAKVRNSCDKPLGATATGGSAAPRVHVIKLTEACAITPYTWVSPTTATAAEGILLASNWGRRPRDLNGLSWLEV